MKRKLRIDGIYDTRTFQTLEKRGITDYNFDFRPLSFNFLQQHTFFDLLNHCFRPNNRHFLHYSNEGDFVTWKMINDLKELPQLSTLEDPLSSFYLEFSDLKGGQFYDMFSMPYFWHYTPEISLNSILESEWIAGLVLSFTFLQNLHHKGNLRNFVWNFHQQIYPLLEERNLELVLSLDWDSDIFPSLWETFDFNLLALPINNKIEVCYRNVDLKKIGRHIGNFLV